MLISKFDLYKSEWLDLVFDDRNKEYGAYNLRQHYANTMIRAMGITFLGVALLFAVSVIIKPKQVEVDRRILISIAPPPSPPPAEAKKKIIPPAPKANKQDAPTKTVATIKNLPPVVGPDNKAQTMPTDDALKKAVIGTETVKGSIPEGYPPDEPKIEGDGPSVPDNTVYYPNGLDVMPTPVGGDAAWAKFLNKNLHFPPIAQEEGVGGKVFLTFIIEKDGHLTDITVIRPAGHGFDEEALRVLKMAKAWKPGMQNGRPVRVKYTIPINFQIAE